MLAHAAPERFILYGGAWGGGKLLSLDTLLPVPNGWKLLRDIIVGDMVFDEQGKPCLVKFISGVNYTEPCYKVRFSDASELIAGESHLWVTESNDERVQQVRRDVRFREKRKLSRPSRGKGLRPDLALLNSEREYDYLEPPAGSIRTTKEIKDTLHTGTEFNHSVPIAGALQLPNRYFALSPYVLGAWLGDGNTDGGGFTNIDLEIIENIREEGFEVRQYTEKEWHIQGLLPFLRQCGVLNNKHVPLEYLRASSKQRWELLRGIMDTDGYCDSRGACEILLTNRSLIDGVWELILSLGIKANLSIGRSKLYDKDCGEKYRIKFYSPIPVFTLERKLERQKLSGFRRTVSRRYITAVEPTLIVPTKCIGVDSPSGCYLAGKTMIPTHNTAWLVNEAIRLSWMTPGNVGFIGCRELTQFERNALQQLLKFLPPALYAPPYGMHHQTRHYFRLINGSIIHYGGVGNEMEAEQFISNLPELGWIAIDQAEQISEKQFLLLDGRLRLNLPDIKYKLLLTANPDPGWLRSRFIENNYPDHRYIPARPKDNPFLPANYEEEKRKIYPEEMVRRFMEGDWDIPGINYLFPYDHIRGAINRELPAAGVMVAGVDVARYGDDQSVFIARQGHKVLDIKSWAKMDTTFSVGKVAELIREYQPLMTNIDAVGIGVGVFDPLRSAGYKVKEVNVAEKSSQPEQYVNLRAEYYNKLAKKFELGEMDIPDHAELSSNLAGIKYHYKGTAMQIESKEVARKHGGKSPDFADALMLAFIDSGVPEPAKCFAGGRQIW